MFVMDRAGPCVNREQAGPAKIGGPLGRRHDDAVDVDVDVDGDVDGDDRNDPGKDLERQPLLAFLKAPEGTVMRRPAPGGVAVVAVAVAVNDQVNDHDHVNDHGSIRLLLKTLRVLSEKEQPPVRSLLLSPLHRQ
jgi:hypothetical protein